MVDEILLKLKVLINKYLLKYCKYCIVGAIGAITDFSIYTALIRVLSLNYIFANLFSISVALVIVYFFQKSWTFKNVSKDKSKSFHRYLVSVALTYFLNNGIIFILIGIMGYDEILSKIIQIALSSIWGYILSNYYVFVKNEEIIDIK